MPASSHAAITVDPAGTCTVMSSTFTDTSSGAVDALTDADDEADDDDDEDAHAQLEEG